MFECPVKKKLAIFGQVWVPYEELFIHEKFHQDHPFIVE
jgi:hypothetical protein